MSSRARPIYVAILGSDALLASRPHDPVQVMHACLGAGFDLVVPVSWGEEVIATQLSEHLVADTSDQSLIAVLCPLVEERLAETPSETRTVTSVPPPVATARYVRAAYQSHKVHLTYVGACPGASNPEIDVHCLPATLFTQLVEAGIDIARQPRQLNEHLPVERARYASRPGGIPETNWLIAHAGVRVVEAAPITADVVTRLHGNEPLLIDLAVSCKCVCAKDRLALSRIEPSRSQLPVLRDIRVAVWEETDTIDDDFKPDFVPIVDPPAPKEKPVADRRARFAENGLEGDATPLSPDPESLSQTIEPW